MSPVELFQDFTLCRVKFTPSANNKTYVYKVPRNVNLECGDLVLVLTPNEGVQTRMVVAVNCQPDTEFTGKHKWIVQKVDMTQYKELVEKEEQVEQILFQAKAMAEKERVKKEFLNFLPADLQQKLLAVYGENGEIVDAVLS